MVSFRWGKHFETGIDAVDSQHHALVDLINRFGESMQQQGLSSGDTGRLFQDLAAYAHNHFEDEEAMMRRIGLDPRHIDQHEELHAKFMVELTLMRETGAQEQSHETGQRLLNFLTHWLAFHILGIDQSMARQVAYVESGHDAGAAFLREKDEREDATEPLLEALHGLFQQVSERNRELRELNRTLEEKVAQRTQSLFEVNQTLEQISLTDVLTGLPNRRHALAHLGLASSESARDGAPLSCLMLDADGFKVINDQHGHDAGDEVLRQLARHLVYAVRTDDAVCRLGGDEFLVICPGTEFAGAMQLAEAVRREIAGLRVPVGQGGEWSGSISIGVAARTPDMGSTDDLIKAADEGLYVAKRDGRNCVRASEVQAVAAQSPHGGK